MQFIYAIFVEVGYLSYVVIS